ncbi:microtubule-associated protein 1A-like isoform X2 [Dreissena polymorpha]|uniref:microtubule-associated protein 1A-like isoform X2 n=1 Tax=Dreissena polymorpha TaxID=45954 RepID=UPI002263D6B3|nr:microtubule-associated protein 1A-like isoform X2 [Dreissena polymorpha]
MDTANNDGGLDLQIVALKGASVLLIIGEPFTEEHRKLTLLEVTKGFKCWDAAGTGVDINDALAQVANRADLGEEGPDGERVIRYNSEDLSVDILVNPQAKTVALATQTLLATPSKHKHIIYAGLSYAGTGAWVLQDDIFTLDDFAHVAKDSDVENSLRQQHGASLHIVTSAEGGWSNGHVNKADFAKLINVTLNPPDKADTQHGVMQFVAYISNFVKVTELNDLMRSSDLVGTIKFSGPTLYIFPSCQGDSALFGINGFNMLINGGYSRKSCFWDFSRHLERVDAALVTHLGPDNLFGLKSLLQRKSMEKIQPDIGFMFVNSSDKIKAHTESEEVKEETLQINLAEEGNKLMQFARQIGQTPHPVTRSVSGPTPEPINLYHKIGIGSLDMYILNPITDSKELKDFFQQWNQKVAHFGSNQHLPLPNILSVCALLVWRPSDPNTNITRIFFPGNAPQHKILEGLERLKTLDILKHATCTKTSLLSKPAKKPATVSTKPPTKPKVSPATTPRNETPIEKPKKEVAPKEVKEVAPKVAAAPKPKPAPAMPKAKKEDVNKKASKTQEAKPAPPKAEKVTKSAPPKAAPAKTSKTSTPSKSSAKSSSSSSPKLTSSPIKGPEKKEVVEPPKEPSADVEPEATVNETENLVDLSSHENGHEESHTETEEEQTPTSQQDEEESAANEHQDEEIEPHSFTEPTEPEEESGHGAMDRQKMRDLGIYDEDESIDDKQGEEEYRYEDREQGMYGGMADSMHEDLMGGFNESGNTRKGFQEDLMTGSMHESMYDNNSPFDGPVNTENGGTNLDDLMTPEDETSEEIQPQALPEPVAYPPESYGQEPDLIPVIAAKEESLLVEHGGIPQCHEPDLVPVSQDLKTESLGEDTTADVADTPDEAKGFLDQDDTPDEAKRFLDQDDGIVDSEEKDIGKDIENDVAQTEETIEDDDNLKKQEEEVTHEEGRDNEAYRYEDEELAKEENSLKDSEEEIECGVIDDVVKPESKVVETYDAIDEMIAVQDEESEEMYRPKSPEPVEQEMFPEECKLEETPASVNEVGCIGNTEMERPHIPVDNEDELDKSDSDAEQPEMINETNFSQQFSKDDESNRARTPDSEEERAESPDSQEGAEDLVRSSVERDEQRSDSPVDEENGERDSMEREFEPSDSVEREEETRESVEREDETRDSLEREHETSFARDTEDRDSMEKDGPVGHSSGQEEEQNENQEGSYEDESEETEETDDDEDDEEQQSSSYDQEENTDEKCLIPENLSNLKYVAEEKPQETDLLDAPTQYDQPTDSILTPESEYTSASHGGQIGYHEMGDQDEDSAEGFEMRQESPVEQQTNPFGDRYDQMGKASNSSNPFDSYDPSYSNPYDGFGGFHQPGAHNSQHEDEEEEEHGGPASFDPVSEWGRPMGLPSPPPPDAKPAEGKPASVATKSPRPKSAPKNDAAKKPESDKEKKIPAKKPAAAAPKPAASNGVPEKSKTSNLNSTRLSTGGNPNASRLSMGGKTTSNPRPTSAPAKPAEEKPKVNGTNTNKRPATATAASTKTAAVAPKMPPLPAFNSYYVDLTYIPNHGNTHYSDVEFFKRVRARYYVLSALSPNKQILDALLEGKSTWEDKSLPVTIIPTYENDTLISWNTLHKDKMAEMNIDIAPSASRCTVQLHDTETGLSAYRLLF